jgi:hypothetical protein
MTSPDYDCTYAPANHGTGSLMPERPALYVDALEERPDVEGFRLGGAADADEGCGSGGRPTTWTRNPNSPTSTRSTSLTSSWTRAAGF